MKSRQNMQNLYIYMYVYIYVAVWKRPDTPQYSKLYQVLSKELQEYSSHPYFTVMEPMGKIMILQWWACAQAVMKLTHHLFRAVWRWKDRVLDTTETLEWNSLQVTFSKSRDFTIKSSVPSSCTAPELHEVTAPGSLMPYCSVFF